MYPKLVSVSQSVGGRVRRRRVVSRAASRRSQEAHNPFSRHFNFCRSFFANQKEVQTREATMASSFSTRLILLGLLAVNHHVASSSNVKKEGDATRLQKESDENQSHFDGDADSTQYKHFVAHNQTMTCSVDEHATPFNNQIRGVNLGGWMVLEPWITPSIFYQFLGKGEGEVAIDTYSFCEVLGPEEGNRQLRNHWKTWVTEDDIKKLADSGAVNSLRLPVGDFNFEAYGPYIGCTDGALDYIENLLDWAHEYGLSVLIDVHTAKDSQNGFDNSGKTLGFEWTSTLNVYPRNLVTFQHWPIRTAEWMGVFDRHNGNYTSINHSNIRHSLRVIQKIVDEYSGHPAVLGLEPVNEPWEKTPIEHLKRFYWEGYLIVKKKAPYWKYIMHDSFRFDPNIWGGFMSGCPDRALDTHIYQAWLDPASRASFYTDACHQKKNIAAMEQAFGPVVVGEWSLATDNCAMWLNGFNDNLPGFPRLPCKYVPCGESYLNSDDYQQPGTPIDPSKPIQGPYGTGMSGPVWGLCPVGRDWLKETGDSSDFIHTPAEAPERRDDTDTVMANLALKKINAFSGIGHGFYFWNWKTDLDEPHWSYTAALERGWIPSGNLNSDAVLSACDKEDDGLYECVSKRDQLETVVRNNIKGILVAEEGDQTNTTYVDSLSGDDLFDEADKTFDAYWQAHRVEGATCDFGGLATLQEINATYAEDDDVYSDYEPPASQHVFLKLLIVLLGGLIIGGGVGFFIAMRANKSFNERVVRQMEHNCMLRPISHSRVFRTSFATMDLGQYETIPVASSKAGGLKSAMKTSKSAAV